MHYFHNVFQLLYRTVATGMVGPVFTGPLSGELRHVYIIVLRINVTRSQYSHDIYNCAVTPPSVYVYFKHEVSNMAGFSICSSFCSFTPEIASEMISEGLNSKTNFHTPLGHTSCTTIIHFVCCEHD